MNKMQEIKNCFPLSRSLGDVIFIGEWTISCSPLGNINMRHRYHTEIRSTVGVVSDPTAIIVSNIKKAMEV